MPFVQPITIKEAIDNIHRKNYLLPAIQREFVWDTDQIERLFDSLMRDYPISSFLFWNVDKSNVNKYQFYEFLRDYHERDSVHNPKANVNGESGIIAILDGQQRLTSLYVGLKGTYAYRLPRKRWDNDSAFPKRTLCINLLAKPDNPDLEFDFQFLTRNESDLRDGNHFWFPVGEILNLEEAVDINDYLAKNDLFSQDKEKVRFANKALFKLFEVVHKNRSINFFLEEGDSLDKVLNIFIRVNSGGTILSYSDLLLSIATAQWKHKDAREEITSFVDDINSVGDGFNFDKDFVLKSCLVLAKFTDIAFRVDNFNKENMLHIENNWDDISKSIKAAVILLSARGYHRDTLSSNNALIPIAFYLNKIGSPDNYSDSQKFERDRAKIFKWLVIVLLKRTFSGQPDNVLRPIREVLASNNSNGFPLDDIIYKLKGTPKALSFADDEVDNLMRYRYGESYIYSVLSFLYPSLDFRNKFHQDHIFPKKLFTESRLLKRGIPNDQIDYYINNHNYLANIQLLEGVPNQEKSGKDFDKWLKEKYPKTLDRHAYMQRNYIPDIDLSLENFPKFIEERTKLIVDAFKQLIK